MRLRTGRGQAGQALLLVLVFLAAFLILVWAALTLAGTSFLGLSAVQSDTRITYALDAGLDYAIKAIDLKNGNGCNAPKTVGPLVLNYPSGNISVSASISKPTPCHVGGFATYTLTVSSPATGRTLKA